MLQPNPKFLCPQCQGEAPEVEVEPGLTLNLCSACHSVWLDQGELAAYVGAPTDFPEPRYSKGAGNPSPLACPRCQGLHLAEIPYNHSHSVTVTACLRCDGIWMKLGDIQKVRTIRAVEHVLRPNLKLVPNSTSAPAITETDSDEEPGGEYAFTSLAADGLAIPLALLFGVVGNATFIISFLLGFVCIQFHEMGHAVSAWLGSRLAFPLPLGFTSWAGQSNTGVYVLCCAATIGAVVWGWQKRNFTLPAIALVWTLAQTYMTFVLPAARLEYCMVFGGILGSFYLSTLGIVAFYYPLPKAMRWDFWRLPVLFLSMFAFVDVFSKWRAIAKGTAKLPRGSMLFGADDKNGDIDRLIDLFGWTPETLIHFMQRLSMVCVLVIASHYIAGLLIVAYQTVSNRK